MATVAHGYTFESGETAHGTYTVTVADRAANESALLFQVLQDYVSPTVALAVPARVATTTIPVSWSSVETGSGLAGYDLEVSVDGGGWERLLTGTLTTTYTYSGTLGGQYTFRVRAMDNVGNTGDWAEGSARVVMARKYYYIDGQRVAMRDNGVVYYLHGDHLGSTSLATNAGGAIVAEQRYYPYGETRWSWGTLPTDYAFTGQRNEAGIGLMDYRARYYSPYLNRWIQPDPIIPDLGNPQSLNRYSYVYNRPLVYVDQDGHFPWLIVPVLAVAAVFCTRSAMDPVLANGIRYVESLRTIAPTDLDALTTMFTTDQLSGDTPQDRFATISRHLSTVPGLLYTGGGFGETGLNRDFQDGYMYEQHWGGETKQIGHFWTAAVYGTYASNSSSHEEFFMQLAVGHEMVGDHRFIKQFRAATEEARSLFRQAVAADIWGDYGSRDEYLTQILTMQGGSLENRKGNSLEDLRLTVRGWRFGQMIANGMFASRDEAAKWLNDNLR